VAVRLARGEPLDHRVEQRIPGAEVVGGGPAGRRARVWTARFGERVDAALTENGDRGTCVATA